MIFLLSLLQSTKLFVAQRNLTLLPVMMTQRSYTNAFVLMAVTATSFIAGTMSLQ
jgi:hypothetical protein